MAHNPNDHVYTDEETAVREEETLRRLLNTPPKPHKAMPKKRVESQPK